MEIFFQTAACSIKLNTDLKLKLKPSYQMNYMNVVVILVDNWIKTSEPNKRWDFQLNTFHMLYTIFKHCNIWKNNTTKAA